MDMKLGLLRQRKDIGRRCLGKVSESNRQEVTGGRKILHVEELRNTFCPPNVILMLQSQEDKKGGICDVRGG
jgi:hypothetical protein